MYNNWTNKYESNGLNNQRPDFQNFQRGNLNIDSYQQSEYSLRNPIQDDLNSRKDNGTWECNICNKIFHQRKGYYQHINSNTHQPIKHSCSLCGKGFASLGALALHNEQASHAFLNNRETNMSNEVTGTFEVSKSVSSNRHVSSQAPQFTGPQKKIQHAPNNNYSSDRNSFANVNDFHTNYYTYNVAPIASRPANMNVNSINKWYPNQFEQSGRMPLPPPSVSFNSFEEANAAKITERSFELYVGGLVDFSSKVGAFGWILADNSHDSILFQHAVSFVDCQWTTEQLEYQALLQGLKALYSRGMKNIKIRNCSQLVMSHLMNESSLHAFGEITYRELECFKAEVLPLLHLFEVITFETDRDDAFYVSVIIKKKISDCIVRLKGGNNFSFAGPGSSTNTAIANTDSHNRSQTMHFYPQQQAPEQAPFHPSVAGRGTSLFGAIGKTSVTSAAAVVDDTAWNNNNNNFAVSTDTYDSFAKITEDGGDGEGVTDDAVSFGSAAPHDIVSQSGGVGSSTMCTDLKFGDWSTTKSTDHHFQQNIELNPFYYEQPALGSFHAASSRFNE